MKPPLYRQWRVSLLVGRSILHQRGRQTLLFFLTLGLLTHFAPPCFCLALPTMTQFCDWSHSSWGSLSVSQALTSLPSALCMCSFQGLQPHHITCGLHLSSVDTPVDVHGRSHNFPFFHPREALLVGLSGNCLTNFLWHPLSFTSYRGSLAWGWG